MNRLFVYGIFLDESARGRYGMSEAYYATVEGFATIKTTFRGTIVAAVRDPRYTLTGMIVEVDPDFWQALDRVEAGYDRIKVETTDGEECWMYVLGHIK